MSLLINRKATKQFILAKCEAMRPHLKLSRVKGDVFEQLDAKVRALIIAEIQGHPSKGKTFELSPKGLI